MKLVLTTCLLLLINLFSAYSQDIKPISNPEKPTLIWSGFVKAEALYDTRQIVEAREGYLLLYPKKCIPR